MKTNCISSVLVIGLAATCAGLWLRPRAGEPQTFQKFEFATIRWDGRDNTHMVRPDGRVELLASLLARVKRPDRADDRAFYLNIAVNAAATEGFDVAAATSDTILLRRPCLP